MSLFDRIKEDKVAVATSVLLVGSLLAKLLQAGLLHIMTDYYPLTSDNIMNTIIGIVPTLLLLVYMLKFYKTEQPQLLLPSTFVFQLASIVLYAWIDYQDTRKVTGDLIFANGIWVIYYAFLIFVTYKGFENINMIRIIMGALIAYSTISSIVTLAVVWKEFPEETILLTAQAIAIVGNICYYLATILIVPKVVKGQSKTVLS